MRTRSPFTARTTFLEKEAIVGEAREVMDQMTAASNNKDFDALGKLYAEDAVVTTPDGGEIHGRERIVEYFKGYGDAFSESKFEPAAAHEAGNVAIDEGYFVGTNTGPLTTPAGEQPATGKQIRLRECDIAVVEGGVITQHRFYYDQMEFLSQLGLLPDTPA
jgi:uncharacterized protein (TIGR02246 family)